MKRSTKSDAYRLKFASTPPMPEPRSSRGITLRLPLPPTANNLKAIRTLAGRRAFLVPTTEYNVYKEVVAAAWHKQFGDYHPEPLESRLRVTLVVHQARKGGDVANREKGVIDALTECGAWKDDEQIDDLHILRGEVIPGIGAVDLTVEVIPNGDPT